MPLHFGGGNVDYARLTVFASGKQMSYVQASFSLQGVGMQYASTVQPKAGRSEKVYYLAK